MPCFGACKAWVLQRGSRKSTAVLGPITENGMDVNSGENIFKGISVAIFK